MTIEDALRIPIVQFATLHVLAATAICSGKGTANGHAMLRFSPATCLHELIEHCAYAAHALQDNFMLRFPSGQNAEGRPTILSGAQLCGISASMAITIYLTLCPWVISWTILFSWIYTLRSLSLLLLPPLTSLQDAVSTMDATRIKQKIAMTRATVVHLTACAMIPASDQASGMLIIGGGVLITVAAFGFDEMFRRQPREGVTVLSLVAGGLLHNLWIGTAFLMPSMRRVDDDAVGIAVGWFDGAWLSVQLSRGFDNVYHAVLFAATVWCVGFIFYGMAPF